MKANSNIQGLDLKPKGKTFQAEGQLLQWFNVKLSLECSGDQKKGCAWNLGSEGKRHTTCDH